jgi:hypothetical protein
MQRAGYGLKTTSTPADSLASDLKQNKGPNGTYLSAFNIAQGEMLLLRAIQNIVSPAQAGAQVEVCDLMQNLGPRPAPGRLLK